jgi:hypothetical protein
VLTKYPIDNTKINNEYCNIYNGVFNKSLISEKLHELFYIILDKSQSICMENNNIDLIYIDLNKYPIEKII